MMGDTVVYSRRCGETGENHPGRKGETCSEAPAALSQKLRQQKTKKMFHGLYDYVQTNLTYCLVILA